MGRATTIDWRIDPETREATLARPLRRTPRYESRITYRLSPQLDLPAGELVWFGAVPGIAVFDLATAGRVANFPLTFHSASWFVDNESGWIASQLDDTVWQLDASTIQVARKIHVGKGPRGIAVGEGSVWVANSVDGTVSRIDPASGNVVATIEIGGRPDDIAVGEGGVWVMTYPA